MKWKKRVLSLLLAACLAVGMLPVTAFAENEPQMQAQQQENQQNAAMPFTDVKESDWFYPYVQYVYENGLMNGMSDTEFGPQEKVNRAMVVQILYAQAGKPEVSGGVPFSDVSEKDWFCQAVIWAKSVGVTAGDGGKFNPYQSITREQFALMLYAYIGKPEVSGELTGFADAGSVSGWAKTGMTWACQNKLFSGENRNGAMYLNPLGKTTRAQAATILKAFCENVVNAAAKVYSITDLAVEGKAVTVEVTASQACTVQVDFLNENTEQELNVTATAAVPAGTEMETVTATATGMLPTHFLAVVRLLDADGNQLCNQYQCIKYTTNYETFEAQTVDDFADETVINFDDDKTDNFGVLADSVREPTVASGKNIIAENEDGTYTVKNIDASVESLQPGDEALFYDADGEPVLVSIAAIEISGTAATITRDKDATLEDFYQVLKVDMSVAAEPDDIDMSEADEGIALLNQANSQESGEKTQSSQKNIDVIDEDTEFGMTLEFGVDYETDHFKTSGKLELKETITVEISYDVVLFGKDYIYCKMVSNTKGSFSLEVKAKADNSEAVGNQTDKAAIDMGKIPFPLGYGFSCSVALTIPIEISLEGGAVLEESYSMKSGFTYSTKDGKQKICKKSFDTTFVQAEAKFEIKAGPKVAVSIEFLEDVLKCEISGQVGGDFEAEAKTGSLGDTDEESIHMCALCADGDVYLFMNAKAELTFQITEQLKGTPFSATLIEIKQHLFAFYVSMINEEESPLGGKVTFGKGSCPNQQYRTTFHVKDLHGVEASGTEISVWGEQDRFALTESGEAVYLYNGEYTAECRLNGRKLSRAFTVDDAASSVTLSEQDDVVTPIDPDTPDPSDIVASGTCGDNLTWTLDTEGHLIIKGTGEMYNWSSSQEVPWYNFTDQVETITIGTGATSIGQYAFKDCDILTSVTIPDSVTTIGRYAFYDCAGLTGLKIPDSATDIGTHAFYGCDGLTSVKVPASVTNIGAGAFGHCDGLTAINMDENNTAYCSVDGVLLNNDQTELLQYPGGKSGTYTIPDSVTSISDDAFSFCVGITGVTIGDNVASIGEYAFEFCKNLISATIGNGVKSIGYEAFFSCYSLMDVTIGNRVASIGDYAFADCNSLTSITIPGRVSSLNNHTFTRCTSLTNVTFENGVSNIGDSMFLNCTSLTSVEIPDSVTTIGREAFEKCTSLTSVTIPNRVTGISMYTFSGCTGLASVTIPDSVTTIGDSAFYSCDSLADVYYRGSEEQWAAITIDSSNDPLTSATIHYNS